MAAQSLFPISRNLPSSVLQQAADGILNLIYPDTCFICSLHIIRQRDCGICDPCWDRTLRLQIRRPWCAACGLPFQWAGDDTAQLCFDCSLHMLPYSGARSFGYYTSELSRLIQGFKFHGRQNIANLLAPLLARTFVISWQREEFDLVIPVPLHPRRRRQRGFNQAALLARSLARLIGIPYCGTALARIRDTGPQVGLSDSERIQNIRNAFKCLKPELVAKKRVLLIDDVMTTGATAAGASESLLKGGAPRVSLLTVARAVPGF